MTYPSAGNEETGSTRIYMKIWSNGQIVQEPYTGECNQDQNYLST